MAGTTVAARSCLWGAGHAKLGMRHRAGCLPNRPVPMMSKQDAYRIALCHMMSKVERIS